jgi:hypothetical protein
MQVVSLRDIFKAFGFEQQGGFHSLCNVKTKNSGKRPRIIQNTIFILKQLFARTGRYKWKKMKKVRSGALQKVFIMRFYSHPADTKISNRGISGNRVRSNRNNVLGECL